ncbi:MAG: molybdenum cofactor guanylyltransferase [Chitinophagaceae bacterium]|nr:molybdenum cofactor guanylyltransferase [Chitinophagaceae bacterium]
MDKLIGVILCGGESRRMGRDKGLILKKGTPWAFYMAEKLTSFCLPVVFSVNAMQTDDYAAQFPGVRLVVDKEVIPAGGPLKGVLSVHQEFPENDLLLLACDMMDVDLATIGQLVEGYRAGGDYEWYAYQREGFFEPFCAIYTAAGLEMAQLNISLQGLLKQGRTKGLAVTNSEAFKNYNTL